MIEDGEARGVEVEVAARPPARRSGTGAWCGAAWSISNADLLLTLEELVGPRAPAARGSRRRSAGCARPSPAGSPISASRGVPDGVLERRPRLLLGLLGHGPRGPRRSPLQALRSHPLRARHGASRRADPDRSEGPGDWITKPSTDWSRHKQEIEDIHLRPPGAGDPRHRRRTSWSRHSASARTSWRFTLNHRGRHAGLGDVARPTGGRPA